MHWCCLAVGVFLAAEAGADSAGWAIGRAPGSHACVERAVTELAFALNRCTGTDYEILEGASGSQPTILVGVMDDVIFGRHAEKLGLKAGDDDQIVIKALKAGHLGIVGNSPGAALRGTYAFLHRFVGVRHLWLGEEGTFYPRLKRLEIPPDVDWRYTPKIRWRGYNLAGEWYRASDFLVWMSRNGMNAFCGPAANRRKELGFRTMGGGHILSIYDGKLFEEHPDWFAVVNGKRNKANLCFSNFDSVETVASQIAGLYGVGTGEMLYLNMYAADVGEKCECPRCKSHPFSVNVFRYHQRVSQVLRGQFPDQPISALAYSGYVQPPSFKMEIIDQVQIATHNKCNHHAVSDPKCPWNRKLIELYDAWKQYDERFYEGKLPIGEYGYDFEVYVSRGNTRFVPNFSLLEDSVRTSVRYGHHLILPEAPLSPKNGEPEEVNSVQNRLPMAYFAQVLWDDTLTAEAFIDDTARTVWGPGGTAMAKYFKLLDKAWRSAGRCVLMLKNPLDDAGCFLTKDVDAKAQALLDEAERLVTGADSRAEEAYPTFDRTRALDALAFERGQLDLWRGQARIVRGEAEPLAGGRPMAVWIGYPSRDGGDRHKIEHYLRERGFRATVTDNEAAFKVALRDAQVIWMRHPGVREDTLPEGVWKTIKRKVRGDGALLVCSSHWRINLDAALGDQSLALRWVRIEGMDPFKRKFTTVAGGDWSRKPHDFSGRLKGGLAGGYTFDPVKRDKWTILAYEKNLDGQPDAPSIMMRDYGKGRILVFGLSIALPEYDLIENIFTLGSNGGLK